MQRYLKFFRLGASILMLAAISFLFLDFNDSLSAAWYKWITWLQFTPSLINFMQSVAHGLAVSAYGFIVVLVFTLLFGRVYCSYICPLGIFQDVTTWCSKKLRNIGKKKFRFRYAPQKKWMRYSILVIFVLSIFTGGFLLSLLDPFSNFGRFVSDLFRPVYIMANNVLVSILNSLGSYILYPVTVAQTNPYALIVPGVMLALVIWLSAWKGRLYCNAICPVGTLLGLVSKISLFKIRFDATSCNQCGTCMFVCKSQCIDVKNREVDFPRCVGCGNCIQSCDKSAIRYSLSLTRKPKTNVPVDVSKRHFFAGSALFLATLSGFSVPVHARNRRRKACDDSDEHCGRCSGKGTGKVEFVPERVATPPGSLARDHFTKSCTACHLCVSACPTGVLKPSFVEYGFYGMMQPYMDYEDSFCNYECTKCSEVCPNGAIFPLTVEKKITTQIGLVRFEKKNCIVVTEGTSCGSCSEHCPTKAVRMVPYRGALTIPEITPEICVGCGACEYACPVTPYKAIVVDGHLIHANAQKPEEEKLEVEQLKEFPF